MDKSAAKYVLENTEKMTRWAVTAFQNWTDTHNAQLTNVKCLINLLVKLVYERSVSPDSLLKLNREGSTYVSH